MKRAFLFIIPVVGVLCIACHKQKFDERVIAEIQHFNKKEAPKRLDIYTTFDSMAYDVSNQTLTYFYTVEGEADSDLFPVDAFKQQLKENLHSSLQLKAHKEHGLSFRYLYLSQQTGKPRLDCTFTTEDYQ